MGSWRDSLKVGLGRFSAEVGDHLGLEPGVGGSGGQLVVVGVEVLFDLLALREWVVSYFWMSSKCSRMWLRSLLSASRQ